MHNHVIVRMAPVLYSRFDNGAAAAVVVHIRVQWMIFSFSFQLLFIGNSKRLKFSVFHFSLHNRRMDSFFAFFDLYYCIFYSKFIVHTNSSIDYFSKKKWRKKNAVNIRKYLFYCKMEMVKYHVYFLPTRMLMPTKGILIFHFWTKASMDMVITTFVWNWINIVASAGKWALSGPCHTDS